ncbi:MAG: exonuclease subunit SbcD [Desulfobacter sp.]|nr:MAG: exonuclease subunit SbcD [Desulfobacter sp.]
MRILHTSDWHLGQHFMGRTRETEHRAFLNWLIEQIRERRADGLVVAGDIFDTGAPPSYARTLYNEFIVSLQNTGCRQALILGGNHDAAATLNEGRSILSCLNTRVVAGISDDPQDHAMLFTDRNGEPGLVVCALPFMRPRDLVKSLGGQSGQDKQQAVGRAIREVYGQVAAAAERLCPEKGLPMMATGHLTVVGGKSSESVRDIYIGSLDAFPADGFPEADYIALGHLHRGQRIKGRAHIRYSGSPIPLSFDEGAGEKQILQVDFESTGLKSVEPVAVPCFRTLATLKGSLEDIEAGIRALKAGGGKGTLSPAWLEAEVSADHYLTDLQDRIQAVIGEVFGEEGGLELLRIRRKRKNGGPGRVTEVKERLEELNPKEVFDRRLEDEDLTHEQRAAMKTLFDEILETVRGAEK